MKSDKEKQLQRLQEEIAETKLPLSESNLVFGEGNPDCAVLFIGEAPGLTEDQQKSPFVGGVGQLLNKCIEEIGWKRESVYITNIVKRRPPENRDPLPEEIEAYKPYLTRQIEIINPRVIATLGRFSMNYFLPFAKISRDQGKPFEKDGRIIYPMFHPAAALRGTTVMDQFKETFKRLPEVIANAKELSSNVVLPDEPIQRPTNPQKSLF